MANNKSSAELFDDLAKEFPRVQHVLYDASSYGGPRYSDTAWLAQLAASLLAERNEARALAESRGEQLRQVYGLVFQNSMMDDDETIKGIQDVLRSAAAKEQENERTIFRPRD